MKNYLYMSVNNPDYDDVAVIIANDGITVEGEFILGTKFPKQDLIEDYDGIYFYMNSTKGKYSDNANSRVDIFSRSIIVLASSFPNKRFVVCSLRNGLFDKYEEEINKILGSTELIDLVENPDYHGENISFVVL